MGFFRLGFEPPSGGGSSVSPVAGLGRNVDRVLAGPTAGTLARDHYSLQEQFAAPDAPGLAPLKRTGQAESLNGAVLAESLGVLHVDGRLGEEQLRVVNSARQQLILDPLYRVVEPSEGDLLHAFENADVHVSPPSETLIAGVAVRSKRLDQTERPRIPGFGFRGLEAAEC